MPRALNPDFAATNPAHDASDPLRVVHMCQICPTCNHELQGHRCKLVCTHCGYYMSCADYY